MKPLPNRTAAPLTHDERVAECYLDRPGFLAEIAHETGNRALRAVAMGIIFRDRKPGRRRAP